MCGLAVATTTLMPSLTAVFALMLRPLRVYATHYDVLCSLQGNHTQNNKLLRDDRANKIHQERWAAAVVKDTVHAR
jgi:hypothetical protein